MTPIVEVRGLSFTYPGGATALCDLDFTIENGETVALVGPNGAGKSTLLSHLNGLLPEDPLRDDSPVRIGGLPAIKSNLPQIRRSVGLVFQDPDDQLFCPTVLEDVLFGPMNMGDTYSAALEKAQQAIEDVGLRGLENRPPDQLSVGQRKRACLAGVLACHPLLLALDEPTSHLDPRGRREFIELLSIEAISKIIATHDLELVLEMATRVLVLDGGRLFADGRPHEILADADLMLRHGLDVPHSLQPDSRRAVGHDEFPL